MSFSLNSQVTFIVVPYMIPYTSAQYHPLLRSLDYSSYGVLGPYYARESNLKSVPGREAWGEVMCRDLWFWLQADREWGLASLDFAR